MAFAAMQFWGTDAQAHPSYFTTYCPGCHSATTTCNGCHHHGPVGLKGVTDKTSYAPGETRLGDHHRRQPERLVPGHPL